MFGSDPKKKKKKLAYPKEQMLLMITDTFKVQGNDNLRELCPKNNCEIVIILQNLTNTFQPLVLSINKAVKTYLSGKCKT